MKVSQCQPAIHGRPLQWGHSHRCHWSSVESRLQEYVPSVLLRRCPTWVARSCRGPKGRLKLALKGLSSHVRQMPSHPKLSFFLMRISAGHDPAWVEVVFRKLLLEVQPSYSIRAWLANTAIPHIMFACMVCTQTFTQAPSATSASLKACFRDFILKVRQVPLHWSSSIGSFIRHTLLVLSDHPSLEAWEGALRPMAGRQTGVHEPLTETLVSRVWHVREVSIH